jgi:serine/threonine protein kinase
LADFGFSRTCFDNNTGRRLLSDTYCESAAYVAPEVLKAEPYNAMISDVWSLGVVLFVFLNNRLPFSDSNLKQMLQKQLDKKHIEIGVKKFFQIFEVLKFLVSKKFYTRGSRHIYSESTLHEEQEYMGLDLIL